jgi:hypothetical protein
MLTPVDPRNEAVLALMAIIQCPLSQGKANVTMALRNVAIDPKRTFKIISAYTHKW